MTYNVPTPVLTLARGNAAMVSPTASSEMMQPTVLLDRTFRIRSANRAFCHLLGLSSSVSDGYPLFRVHSGRWDLPALRSLLEKASAQDVAVEEILTLDVPEFGTCRVRLEARRLRRSNSVDLICLAIAECRPVSSRELEQTEVTDSPVCEDTERFAQGIMQAYRETSAALAVVLGSAQMLSAHSDALVRGDAENIREAAQRLQQILSGILADVQSDEAPNGTTTAVPGLRLLKAA